MDKLSAKERNRALDALKTFAKTSVVGYSIEGNVGRDELWKRLRKLVGFDGSLTNVDSASG